MKNRTQTTTILQTSVLVLALSFCPTMGIAAESIQRTIDRAESYILKHQNSDGGWPILPGGKSDVEVTAFAMQALLSKGRGTGWTVVRKGVVFLRNNQKADGSWTGNTAHTIFAVVALTLADTDPDARFKGLQWLRQAQNGDGSWGREMHQPGNPLYTAAVLAGFRRLGFKQGFESVSKAATWLANRISPDGGWSMIRAGDSDVMVTSWVLQGLSVVYDIDVQIAWLKQVQNEDGGFGRQKGGKSDPEITAYAIMALVAGKDPLNTDRVAIGYLKSAQQEDGSFVSATPIELTQPTANLQTTCFALIAIYARKIDEDL